MGDLKLGIQMGYWGAGPNPNTLKMAITAEKLGYDAIFTAEAWGSDVFTPLAWIGAHTSRIRLGTAVAQLSARTPTATAMAALTLDHLSNGRMILGLGVSGPQVVEGWYGQPFAKPLSRTREYVDIIRQVLAREAPVSNEDGEHYPLPYHGKGSWGLGKSLKPITHPLRKDLPIFLGAEGPKNVTMAAEIADGWLPLYYSPYRQEVYADQIKDAKPGFEISQGVAINICDDVEQGLIPIKNNLALYIGGMGAKDRNFHTELMGRMGLEDEARKIQDLFLAGKKDEAVQAVPSSFADEISLVGPIDRVKDRLQAWRETPVTSLLVSARNEKQIQQMAEIVLG
ncbi:MAG: F420-dependent oxidoreductase-like protein [Candidatus Azotimanducaceae bacterium]|jgi:F420-dependent oxidoreductase-like protein